MEFGRGGEPIAIESGVHLRASAIANSPDVRVPSQDSNLTTSGALGSEQPYVASTQLQLNKLPFAAVG